MNDFLYLIKLDENQTKFILNGDSLEHKLKH